MVLHLSALIYIHEPNFMTKPFIIEQLTPKLHEAALLLATVLGPSIVAKKVKISCISREAVVAQLLLNVHAHK